MEELRKLEGEHLHCLSCIRIHCKENEGSCPVEYCKNSCGFYMHRCKWPDHNRDICPEAIVDCTNVASGCKELVKRRDLGPHLEHCPASNLYCRFVYTRRVAAKLGECALEEPSNLIDEQMLEGDMKLLQDSQHPPCLGLSIENDCFRTMYRGSSAFEVPANGRFSSTGLDRQSFFCNQTIRRDEFATHWLTYHLEVQLGTLVKRCPLTLYGCTHGQETLIPSPAGTKLNFDKETDSFLAAPPQSCTNLLSENSQAGVTQYEAKIKEKKELSDFGYGDDEEESYDVLGQLPLEVLLHIFRQVDSMGLWNLSMVNQYFRKVCSSILGKKMGIVYNKWTKDPDTATWSRHRVSGREV